MGGQHSLSGDLFNTTKENQIKSIDSFIFKEICDAIQIHKLNS